MSHPFIITIEVSSENDLEAYGIVESVLEDKRITACYIEPDVDEEIVEDLSVQIKRRATIERIK